MQALGARHDLILCLDCGTLSHAPIAAAGCDVVVADHHLGAETLPPAARRPVAAARFALRHPRETLKLARALR